MPEPCHSVEAEPRLIPVRPSFGHYVRYGVKETQTVLEMCFLRGLSGNPDGKECRCGHAVSGSSETMNTTEELTQYTCMTLEPY